MSARCWNRSFQVLSSHRTFIWRTTHKWENLCGSLGVLSYCYRKKKSKNKCFEESKDSLLHVHHSFIKMAQPIANREPFILRFLQWGEVRAWSMSAWFLQLAECCQRDLHFPYPTQNTKVIYMPKGLGDIGNIAARAQNPSKGYISN